MLDGKRIKNIFGKKVKELRDIKGVTQEELSEYIGIQPNSVTKIETGRTFISADVLANLSNYFNVEPSVFFSKKINYLSEEEVNYINEIKRLLPGFSSEKLKEIYSILLALKK